MRAPSLSRIFWRHRPARPPSHCRRAPAGGKGARRRQRERAEAKAARGRQFRFRDDAGEREFPLSPSSLSFPLFFPFHRRLTALSRGGSSPRAQWHGRLSTCGGPLPPWRATQKEAAFFSCTTCFFFPLFFGPLLLRLFFATVHQPQTPAPVFHLARSPRCSAVRSLTRPPRRRAPPPPRRSCCFSFLSRSAPSRTAPWGRR